MHTEKVDAQDSASVEVSRNGKFDETLSISGHYDVKCFDIDGILKWEDAIENLVVNVGKADLLTQYFKGAAYTAAWYMGLVDNTSFTAYNAADTMASHAGWLESVAYSNAARPTVSFGTASASGGGAGTAGTGSLVSTATTFNINAGATILGAFLTTISTKSGTTGTLYSAGTFTGSSRVVASGDSLVVTYTAQD